MLQSCNLVDTRYFNRDQPTIPLKGCACGNFGDDGPDDSCMAGMACIISMHHEENLCIHPKMEPIGDET